MKNRLFSALMLTVLSTMITVTSFSQTKDDIKDRQFHDDLLDHLTGKWNVTSTAHGSNFTADLEAKWVLNHQFLQIHFKSHQIIPWWNTQMEYLQFIGYNRKNKRYISHGMSIEGDADASEGFAYGYRNGNEFKIVAEFAKDTLIIQRYTWLPDSKSWHIESRPEIAGKEGNLFLEMKLVPAEPTAQKKP